MRDLFPNAFHVARREYRVRVHGRAFKFTTALLGIAVAVLTMLPAILEAVGIEDPPEIAEPSLEEIFIEHVGRRAVSDEEEHLASTGRASDR